MEGRWSLFLSAGLLGGLAGCSTLASRQPTGVPTGPAAPPAGAKAPADAPQQVAAAPPPKNAKLKPGTHVAMGALSEQIAEDTNRPPAERDAARSNARQAYQKAIETDPKFAPAYLALAHSFAATDERERAAEAYQKAAEAAPQDALVWAEQGLFHARTKAWEPAIACLTKATQLAPDNKEYRKKLGFTLTRAGRPDEGYTALTHCMSEAEARYNVAKMLQHVQQPEAARRQALLSLKAKPGFVPAQELLAALPANGGDSGVRPVAYHETVAPRPTAATVPTIQNSRPAAPAKLPPVILGGAQSPGAPTKVGIEGIAD